jgi:hypothetical protein
MRPRARRERQLLRERSRVTHHDARLRRQELRWGGWTPVFPLTGFDLYVLHRYGPQ